jgi:hypothetical protein
MLGKQSYRCKILSSVLPDIGWQGACNHYKYTYKFTLYYFKNIIDFHTFQMNNTRQRQGSNRFLWVPLASYPHQLIHWQ